jgi:hypothetical protein
VIEAAIGYWWNAMSALDSAALTVALVLLTAIAAGAGGMVSPKMRLYGALMGGMLVNVFVKAMGGGYAAALAAMVVTTIVGYVLGCTPFLIQVLRRVRK